MVSARCLLGISFLVAFYGCSRCGSPMAEVQEEDLPFWESDREVVEGMDVHDVYSYMSGSLGGSHNHPIIYADIERNHLIVTGSAGRSVIEDGDVDGALAAYESLLRKCGYVDESEDARTDPNELVVVALSDILPSLEGARSAFTDEEWAVLYSKVSPSGPGFGYFSGNLTGAHDFPTIYGRGGYSGHKLVVVGQGLEQEFRLEESAKAFSAFKKLLKERGFRSAASGSKE